MNYIKSISINEFNGAFLQKIEFAPGFNIISGVNGTGKTTVLRKIKENVGNPRVVEIVGTISKIQGFSPKRNAEKKSVEAAIQYIRQHSRKKQNVYDEALGKAIKDDTFEKYESLGDLFIYDFEAECRDGKLPQPEYMKELAREYNDVIRNIFPDYKISAEWNPAIGSSGGPEIKLITRYGVSLDLSVMSCGESEVLALVFNIYFNKANTDVYLIDEPEIHLNWNLEKNLFVFLDKFADENEKQIIVATHSRIIFNQQFKDKTQCFVFQSGKIVVQKHPPTEYLEEIAGETAELISTTAPVKKTFFVEDRFHQLLIKQLLAFKNGGDVEIIIVKDASGMIHNLYKLIRSNPEFNEKWINAYLLIDGDGKQKMYKDEPRFIHLKRFVAESYFFETKILAKTLLFLVCVLSASSKG